MFSYIGAAYKFLSAFLFGICSVPRAVPVLLMLRMNLVCAMKCCKQWAFAVQRFSTEI